jgi:SecD/SecF fusion protein
VKTAKVAGAVGLGTVALFMVAYYLLPGVLAVVALLCYALFTFAIFKLLGVTLTLPGIAGFILSIGMAVDANILIFERLKEELRSGKTLHAAIEAGFKRAWTSILDSNVTTLITCTILIYFGNGPIKGFAVTLAIGVLISMFTAITLSRNLLHAIVVNEWAQQPGLFGIHRGWFRHEEGQRGLDVIGRRNAYFIFSGLITIPGLIFIVMGGLKPGIEFTGGMQFRYQLPKAATRVEVQRAFEDAGQRDTIAQISREEGRYQALIQTRAKEINEDQRAAIDRTIKNRFGADAKLLEFAQVGGSISSELKWNAIWSVLLASLAIAIYLAFRFATAGFKTGLRFGVSAVIALIHDAIVVLGIFAIMGKLRGWEVDSSFITAVLTIIGFSVHDTIVIFDRIRENVKLRPKDVDFEDTVNDSINQTLARSINTSLTVVITLVALAVFGGPVIRLFTVALLVGIVSGTYSSIFNASPILVVWEQAARKRRGQSARGRRVSAPDIKPMVETPKARPAAAPKVASAANGAQDGEETEEAVAGRPTAAAGGPAKVKPKRKKRF